MKLDKEFFEGGEVLFIGYSSSNPGFSRMIYKAFTNAGLKVFPINTRQGGRGFDIKVYKSLDELPHIPKSAYVLISGKKTKDTVEQLKDKGIKRVLFHNSRLATPEALDICAKAGIETAVACPMMVFGSGLHKLHARIKGVNR